MTPFDSIVETLFRAIRLFGLVIAPMVFPPEPPKIHGPTIVAAIAVVALGAVVVGALRLRSRLGTRVGDLAVALLIVSVIASVVCGAYFRGAHAPLGRGLPFVAVPFWAGLSLVVYAVMAKRSPDKPWTKNMLPALGLLAIVVVMFGVSFRSFQSRERMWWATITREGDVERGLDELVGTALRAHDYKAALVVLDRCIADLPDNCVCITKRAEIRTLAQDTAGALVDAQSAAARCSHDPGASAVLSTTLLASGDATQAESVARRALAGSDDARLHHALALALDRLGRGPEAIASSRRAVELGAGRDAELMLGALLIRENDLEGATKVLSALVARLPNDAEALYDLALIADKRGDYNRAREGYLAALRADPKLANARYNLAMLTARNGVFDEARHHARKFNEITPNDPRYADLLRRIDATAAAMKKP